MPQTLTRPMSSRVVVPAPFELWIALPLLLALLSILLASAFPAASFVPDETDVEAGSALIASL